MTDKVLSEHTTLHLKSTSDRGSKVMTLEHTKYS